RSNTASRDTASETRMRNSSNKTLRLWKGVHSVWAEYGRVLRQCSYPLAERASRTCSRFQVERRSTAFRSILGRNPPLKPFFNFKNVPAVCLLLIAGICWTFEG